MSSINFTTVSIHCIFLLNNFFNFFNRTLKKCTNKKQHSVWIARQTRGKNLLSFHKYFLTSSFYLLYSVKTIVLQIFFLLSEIYECKYAFHSQKIRRKGACDFGKFPFNFATTPLRMFPYRFHFPSMGKKVNRWRIVVVSFSCWETLASAGHLFQLSANIKKKKSKKKFKVINKRLRQFHGAVLINWITWLKVSWQNRWRKKTNKVEKTLHNLKIK